MDKEKFDKFKKNFKQTVKDYAPELIVAGATVIGFTVYAAYVSRAIVKSSPDDITIAEGFGGGGLMITDPETYTQLLEDPSKICYKIDNHHFSLTPNDCTEVH